MADFYEKRMDLKPSLTHHFVNALLGRFKKSIWVTMNIDGLEEPFIMEHQEPEKILQLHGTLTRVYCTVCSKVQPMTMKYFELFRSGTLVKCDQCKPRIPRPSNIGYLVSDVQLYQEESRYLEQSKTMLRPFYSPKLVLVIGTTLGSADALANVQEWSKVPGCKIVYVDKEVDVSKKISKYLDYHLCFKSDDLMRAVAEKMQISMEPSLEKIRKRRSQILSDRLGQMMVANNRIEGFASQPGKLFKLANL
jgi:NAD-dependent histone deacetylase SIR2